MRESTWVRIVKAEEGAFTARSRETVWLFSPLKASNVIERDGWFEVMVTEKGNGRTEKPLLLIFWWTGFGLIRWDWKREKAKERWKAGSCCADLLRCDFGFWPFYCFLSFVNCDGGHLTRPLPSFSLALVDRKQRISASWSIQF